MPVRTLRPIDFPRSLARRVELVPPMSPPLPPRRSGFTLAELLVVLAIVALLVCFLLPALAEARRAGRLALCGSNLHQLGAATQSYGADFHDAIWTFSWKHDRRYSRDEDLPAQPSDMEAAAAQAVDILRRRADRPDIARISGWLPHIYYSHLVLQDYLAQRLPEPMVLCPEDTNRSLWQSDPRAFDSGAFDPGPDDFGNPRKRWPYGSSYMTVGAAFDATVAPSARIRQAEQHNRYITPGASQLGGLLLSQVGFPSSKVHIHDGHQRHKGRSQPFFGLDTATVAVLAFDGSARTQSSAESNNGWVPDLPGGSFPSLFEYSPEAWEPAPVSGEATDVVLGKYRWTRSGLAGVDFGGTEVGLPAR